VGTRELELKDCNTSKGLAIPVRRYDDIVFEDRNVRGVCLVKAGVD
jgi:hypothetical protein